MEFSIGSSGFPQLPKKKRWYVCNLNFEQFMTKPVWLCKETPESKIHWIADEYASVPDYMPRCLDSYMVRRNLNTHIPVEIVEPSKSLETSHPKRQILYEQPPGFPSGRPDPTADYTNGHKQPKNPFQ